MPAAAQLPAINRPRARPPSAGISGSRQQLAAAAPPPPPGAVTQHNAARRDSQGCQHQSRTPVPSLSTHPPPQAWGWGGAWPCAAPPFHGVLHHIPSYTPQVPGAGTIPSCTRDPPHAWRWMASYRLALSFWGDRRLLAHNDLGGRDPRWELLHPLCRVISTRWEERRQRQTGQPRSFKPVLGTPRSPKHRGLSEAWGARAALQ